MAIICPTVTAFDDLSYSKQIEQIAPFVERIHIDLMDGQFAPTASPDVDEIWWPRQLMADIHLMYERPMDCLDQLIKLKPHMVIIHNEADTHHMHFAAELHREGIKTGLAILHDTPIENAYQIMHSFDQILIFSGNLGHQGGSEVDFDLLDKVTKVKEHHPDAEIAWDGGINAQNVRQLADAGVDVLNVGGAIQNSEDPETTYNTLVQLLT